jgi:hypothetical protein
MTLQTFPEQPFPGFTLGSTAAPSTGNLGTIAAGQKVAIIRQAQEDMVITHVGFRAGTVSASGGCEIRIETVDNTGLYTGTLVDSAGANNAKVSTGALTSSTFALFALGSSATISRGQWYAVVFSHNTGTSFQVSSGGTATGLSLIAPYYVLDQGTPTKTRHLVPVHVVLGSSSTVFYRVTYCLPVGSSGSGSSAFNNTNSAAKGLRFQLPVKKRIVGLQWFNASATLGDYNIGILSDAGSEVSNSLTAVDGNMNTEGGNGLQCYWFDNPVTPAINTWYRAIIEPSSATNVTLYHYNLPSNSYTFGFVGAPNWQYCARASGTWTDTDTQIPLIDLIFDQSDDGVGGGSSGVIGS